MFKSPLRGLLPCLMVILTGCMQPQMGPGQMYGPAYQYQQPGYQQPGYPPAGSYGAPGTLIVPPSNAPPYNPGSNGGSTYESDPTDSWTTPESGNSGGGMFDEGGGVPVPKDPASGGSGSPFYEDDFNNSGVQLIPDTESTDAAQVAGLARSSIPDDPLLVARPVSYGFDTNGFRWLQGVLKEHPDSGRFSVTYNPSADDTFQGDMLLIADPEKMHGLRSGTVVQVRGKVDSEHLDSRGRATYQVDQIYEVSRTQ